MWKSERSEDHDGMERNGMYIGSEEKTQRIK